MEDQKEEVGVEKAGGGEKAKAPVFNAEQREAIRSQLLAWIGFPAILLAVAGFVAGTLMSHARENAALSAVQELQPVLRELQAETSVAQATARAAARDTVATLGTVQSSAQRTALAAASAESASKALEGNLDEVVSALIKSIGKEHLVDLLPGLDLVQRAALAKVNDLMRLQPRVFFGSVLGDGNVMPGTQRNGWSIKRLENGRYKITFDKDLRGYPHVVVTLIDSTDDIHSVREVSRSGFVVETWDYQQDKEHFKLWANAFSFVVFEEPQAK